MDYLLELAWRQKQNGQVVQAIETLREFLSEAPNSAEAHGLLAYCLLQSKRLDAAAYEADLALKEGPEYVLSHRAVISVAIAKRNLKKAKAHLEHLFELDPEDPDNFLLRAEFYFWQSEPELAQADLEKAVALDPEHIGAKTELGMHYMLRGETDKAWTLAEEALRTEPESIDAQVLKGFLFLKKGQTQPARDHAVMALRMDPNDHGALRLLTAVKAQSNPLMGMWWRFNAKMNEMGEAGLLTVLIGAFFLYRVLTIYATQQGLIGLARAGQYLWLGLCVWTWVAPSYFEKMLRRELKQVTLRPDF